MFTDPSTRVTWRIPVFAAGARTVDVRDVILAAALRGELEAALSINQASAGGEVQEVSEMWRYERDLITAEETEHWLEARGISLEEFDQFIVHRAEGSGEALDPAGTDEKSQEAARIELLLSGEFDRLAARLSWHFAASLESPAELREEDRRAATPPPPWTCDQRWLDEMLLAETAYRREVNAQLTPTALAQALASLYLPLTHFTFDALDLESLHAAREAFLCVRDDGLSIAEVARDGSYAHARFDALLEDLPEEWQIAFLSAAPGTALPPLARGDGFRLCQVISKSEPSLAEPRIRARLENHVTTQHFSELTARHIRWLLFPFPGHE